MRYLGNDGGSYKRVLNALKPGQTISDRGPSPIQDFSADIDTSNEHIFIIGGIGITPVRSILSAYSHNKQKLKGHLIWAYREPTEETALSAEIKALSKSTLESANHVVSPNHIEEKLLKKVA